MSKYGVLNTRKLPVPQEPAVCQGDVFADMVPREQSLRTYIRRRRGDFTSYGLEIEIEDAGPMAPHRRTGAKRWRVTRDGSLRNGVEYVTNQGEGGRGLDDVIEHLVDIRDAFSDYDREPSWRAAFQMHAGMLPFNISFVRALIITYATLEPALFGQAGYGRFQSNFCVPWCIQPDVPLALLRSTVNNNIAEVYRQAGRFPKYSSLNFAPLPNIGTIEFRLAQTPVGPGAIGDMVSFIEAWDSILNLAAYALENWNHAGYEEVELYDEENDEHYMEEREVERNPAGELQFYYDYALEYTGKFRNQYETDEVASLLDKRDGMLATMLNQVAN